MELFEASGGDSSSGAQALADALSSLAKPLEEISKNTENLRPNAALEEAFGMGPAVKDPLVLTEAERNAKKAEQAKQQKEPKDSGDGPLRVSLLKRIARATEQTAAALGAAGVNAKMANVVSASPATPSRMANVVSATRGGSGASSAAGGVASATSALAGFGSTIAAVTGPLALIGGVALAAGAGLAAITAISYKFVQAFDPSALIGFDMALRDLNAVVGSMLLPIINEATKIIKYFAATIFASANTIMPAIQTLAKSVGDVFVGLMPIVGQIIPVLANLLTFTAELVNLYAVTLLPVLRAFATVAAGWAAVLNSAFGGLLGSTGSVKTFFIQFGQALGRMVTAITAITYRLFGMSGAIDAMLGSLKNGADAALRKDATGVASARNAQIQSVGSIGNELLRAAFQSSGRGGQISEDVNDQEFRNQLIADIEAIKSWDWKAALVSAIQEAISGVVPSPTQVMSGLGANGRDAFVGANVAAGRGILSMLTGGIL